MRLAQVAAWGLHEQVIMIGHEAIAVHDDAVAVAGLAQRFEEACAVAIVIEDGVRWLPRAVT